MGAFKLNLRSDSSDSDNVASPQPVIQPDTAPVADTAAVEHLLAGHTFSDAMDRPQAKPAASLPAAGNILRDRGRRSNTEIADVWDDQYQQKLKDEDTLFAPGELTGALKKASSAAGGISSNISKRVKSAYVAAKAADADAQAPQPHQPVRRQSHTAAQRVVAPATPTYQQQRPRPARPVRPVANTDMVRPVPAARTTPKVQSHYKRRHRPSIFALMRKRRHAFAVVAAIAVVGFAVMSIRGGSAPNAAQSSAVNGAATNAETAPTDSDIAIVGRTTDFDLALPDGITKAETGIALVSPPELDPVYGFNDQLQGSLLKITQQEVPANFKPNVDKSLKDLAESFSAKEVLLSDKTLVYHGFTEQNEGVQSLMFIKFNLLIFISSTEQLDDKTWSDYIKNMQP